MDQGLQHQTRYILNLIKEKKKVGNRLELIMKDFLIRTHSPVTKTDNSKKKKKKGPPLLHSLPLILLPQSRGSDIGIAYSDLS